MGVSGIHSGSRHGSRSQLPLKTTLGRYYFTPAVAGSRGYFTAGEATPNFDAEYGQSIWQWDRDQK